MDGDCVRPYMDLPGFWRLFLSESGAHHAEDVNFARFGWVMVSSLLTLVLTGLVILSCTGVGYSVLQRTSFALLSRVERFVFAAGTGIVFLILLLALLGFVGLLFPIVGWGTVVLFGLTGWPGLRALSRGWSPSTWGWWRSLPRFAQVMVVITAAYGLVYLLTGLAPPLEGDSLFGYLVLPREYARQHRIIVVDYAYGWWFPQNMPVLATLGYLLQGETLAMTLVSFTMGLLCLLTIYAFGKRHLGHGAAVLGAVAFYGMWSVAYINGSGKVDLGWAFFELLAIFAFSIWYFEREMPLRWLSLAGFFLGAALGTKNTALFGILVLPLGVGYKVLWQERRSVGVFMRALLTFALPIVPLSFWMLRTYLLTGNPVYPMFHEFFTGQATSAQIQTNHATGVTGYFRTWWDMSMGFIAYGMGKPIGPVILASVPLVILLRRVDRKVWHILVYCLLTSFLWYFGLQRARHLFPALALLSLLAGYVLGELLTRLPRLGNLAVGFTALYLLFNLALIGRLNLLAQARLPYILGLETREQFLAAHLPAEGVYPSYKMIRYIRQHLPSDARILALLNGNNYYVERPYYHSGYFAGGVVHSADDVGDVLAALRQNKITHIFINQVIVDRYRADPRGPYTGSWLDNLTFQAYYMTRSYCDGPQCLYTLHDVALSRAQESASER
jgi:hypothetical protein